MGLNCIAEGCTTRRLPKHKFCTFHREQFRAENMPNPANPSRFPDPIGRLLAELTTEAMEVQ